MKLYVAYGSNLNLTQMKYRCPNAVPVSTGFLENWELIYRGSKTGAYATIRRKKGSRIPVLIWNIDDLDEKYLDIYEGYPNFYFKQNIYVTFSDGKRRKAMVYIMNQSAKPGKPSQKYISTIKKGYIDNLLDLNFLQKSLDYNKKEFFE